MNIYIYIIFKNFRPTYRRSLALMIKYRRCLALAAAALLKNLPSSVMWSRGPGLSGTPTPFSPSGRFGSRTGGGSTLRLSSAARGLNDGTAFPLTIKLLLLSTPMAVRLGANGSGTSRIPKWGYIASAAEGKEKTPRVKLVSTFSSCAFSFSSFVINSCEKNKKGTKLIISLQGQKVNE